MDLAQPFGANVEKRRWKRQNGFLETHMFIVHARVLATNLGHTFATTKKSHKNIALCEQPFLLRAFLKGK